MNEAKMQVFGKEGECVGDVSLGTLVDNKVDFLIPSYQRGYRWRGREVKALIDDLYTFFDVWTGERYCLQPLVVQPKKNGGGYIVVDGQQRLTTLAIMLLNSSIPAYTEKIDVKSVLADRSKRPSDDDFAQKVWTIGPRESGVDDDNLSALCRKNALRIARLCKEKIEKIREHLSDIVFVFYKLSPYVSVDDDAIARETFRRINAGKVSLTSSELLRALFFEPDAADVGEQYEIAAEWEQIQARLKDDSFWHMFNKDDIPVHSRMDRFFSIVTKCESKDKNPRAAFDKIEADIANAAEYKATRIKNWWTKTMELFWMLQYCYSDLRVYHYIGWLRRCSEYSFSELYRSYKEEKGSFADFLKGIIVNKLGKRLDLLEKEDPDGKKKFKTLGFCYGDDKRELRSFLLLVNLEMMNRMYVARSNVEGDDFDADVGYGCCRFPFCLYDATTWDIEHVASHTTNPIEDREGRRQWAEGVMNETENAELKKRLGLWLEKVRNDLPGESEDSDVDNEFVDLYSCWVKGIGPNEFPTELQKNRIGNLVLLDHETNRGYGNAIFPIKRRIIHEVETGIKIDAEGNGAPAPHRFVVPQTSYVFKKSASALNPKTLQAWTVEDIQRNENEIWQIVNDLKKIRS